MAVRRSNPVPGIAIHLANVLQNARDQGAEPYPIRLSRLVALVGTDGTPESTDSIQKAFKHRHFTTKALFANKKNPDSLVVLNEDVAQLAGSDALLIELLEQTCTTETPIVAVSKLVGKVEKPLRQPLTDNIDSRVKNNGLPTPIGVVEVKKKPHLFLKRMPPREPPDVELAEKLLTALESHRDEATGFPWTMRRLIERIAGTPDPKILKKALASKQLKPRLLISAKGDAAPIALQEDRDLLAGSAGLLKYALTALRSDDNQAIPVAELKKPISKDLKLVFEKAIDHRVAHRHLPPEVGLLWIKKKSHLFLLSDLSALSIAALPPEPSPVPLPVDFASSFETAFTSLDRLHGSHNLVSLVELRRALPVERAIFDHELRELRRAGRFSLSAAEGRHGLTAEEQDAAINENGTLLLFAARRS